MSVLPVFSRKMGFFAPLFPVANAGPAEFGGCDTMQRGMASGSSSGPSRWVGVVRRLLCGASLMRPIQLSGIRSAVACPWAAVVFFITTIGLAYVTNRGTKGQDSGIMQNFSQTAPAAPPAGSAVPGVPNSPGVVPGAVMPSTSVPGVPAAPAAAIPGAAVPSAPAVPAAK